MSKELDNIELRSEKARNIIGQIPPILIRTGISLLSVVIIAILAGSYFVKFDYIVKTTAKIYQTNDSIHIKLKLPANQISRIKKGQTVIIDFDNIPNLYNQRIETNLSDIAAILHISEAGGYYTSEFLLPPTIRTKTGSKIEIKGFVTVNASIITEKISFFNRVLEPVKEIMKRASPDLDSRPS